MTEERMICRAFKATHGEVTEIRYYPEEPAPTKDWTPDCHGKFGSRVNRRSIRRTDEVKESIYWRK